MLVRLNVSSPKVLEFSLNFVQRTYIQICMKDFIFVHIRHIYNLFYREASYSAGTGGFSSGVNTPEV